MSRPLTVGFTCSRSGRYGNRGEPVYRALTLWAEDCRDRGGIPLGPSTHPVELEVTDDRSRTSVVRDRYRDYLNRDVDLLFGPYGSDLTRAALEVVRPTDRVLWNHGGASDDLYGEGSDRLISILAPCSTYFEELPRLMKSLGMNSLTVVHSSVGSFAGHVAGGLLKSAGVEGLPARPVSYDPGADSHQDVVSGLLDPPPGGVVFVSGFEEEIGLIDSLLATGRFPELVGCVAAGVGPFHERLGDRAEGILGPCQWHPDTHGPPEVGPDNQTFLEGYRRRWGQNPDYPAAQAYACGFIAEQILARSGSLEPRNLLRASRDLRTTTFFGDYERDPKTGRQVGKKPVLVQWRAGQTRVVGPGIGGFQPREGPRR